MKKISVILMVLVLLSIVGCCVETTPPASQELKPYPYRPEFLRDCMLKALDDYECKIEWQKDISIANTDRCRYEIKASNRIDYKKFYVFVRISEKEDHSSTVLLKVSSEEYPEYTGIMERVTVSSWRHISSSIVMIGGEWIGLTKKKAKIWVNNLLMRFHSEIDFRKQEKSRKKIISRKLGKK